MRFLLLLIAICLAIFENAIVHFLNKIPLLPWSWVNLIPKVLILILALIGVIKAFGAAKKRFWFLATTFCLGCFVFSFWQKPVYASDYSDNPIVIADKYKDNKLCEKIDLKFKAFDGAVVFVDPDCPHCAEVAKKFNTLKQRKPTRDVVFVLFTRNDSIVSAFKQENEIIDYPVIKSIDELSTVEINEGSFPTITYFRNGDFETRWFGNDFGFTTFDKIEAGLK